MEVVIHCTHCNQSLRVPPGTSGHQARCPACKQMFTIPALDDMLEDTITDWIAHDVEEMLQSKDKAVEASPQETAAAAPAASGGGSARTGTRTRRIDIGEDGKPRKRLWGVRVHEQKPDTVTGDVSPGTRAAAAAATPVMPSPAQEPSRGYPTNLRSEGASPRLVVHRVNTAGVRLLFDAEWLRDERFRAAMPIRCAFTGEADRDKLIARPLIFQDRLLKTGANVEQIAGAHMVRKLSDKPAKKVVQAMGRVEAMPEPFCFAMPYYVSTRFAHYSLHAQAHDRSDGSVTCDVLVPDPSTALDWLGRVNGTCGVEHEMLEHDVSLLHGSAWRQMDDDTRARLDNWCKLDPDEKFRQYFNDADFGVKEAGLAGLIVTDRRIIFNKHHRKGHVQLNRQNTALVAQVDGNMAHLTLDHDGERHRMVTIRAGELDDLGRLLTGERVQLMRT